MVSNMFLNTSKQYNYIVIYMYNILTISFYSRMYV